MNLLKKILFKKDQPFYHSQTGLAKNPIAVKPIGVDFFIPVVFPPVFGKKVISGIVGVGHKIQITMLLCIQNRLDG